jgi:hypothetical protein
VFRELASALPRHPTRNKADMWCGSSIPSRSREFGPPMRGSHWSVETRGRRLTPNRDREQEQIKRFIEETDIDTIDDEMPRACR